jgi:hypothetical protein
MEIYNMRKADNSRMVKRNNSAPKGKKDAVVTKAQIKQMIDGHFKSNTELKWFAKAISSNLDYAGVIFDLSAITQGDTDLTRDGDSVNKEFIEINYQLVRGDITNALRIVLFQYGLNSTPTPTDIWTNLGSSSAPYGIIYPDAKQYVKVLEDRLYSVGDVNTNIVDSIRLKLSGKVQFASATTVGTSKLYLLAISDSAASSHPTIVGSSFLHFRDA